MEVKLTLKDKLQLEKPDENIIRMYHEGIFFVAYQESAVRFKQYINGAVKIIRQQNKNGDSYLRIGIVQDSPMLADLPVRDTEGNWVDSLSVKCPQTQPVSLDEIEPDKVWKRKPNATQVTSSQQPDKSDASASVLKEIRNLSLGNLTMASAMALIVKWNEMLNAEK